MHGGKGTAGCAAELISGSLDDVFASPDSEPHFTILKRQGIKVLYLVFRLSFISGS